MSPARNERLRIPQSMTVLARSRLNLTFPLNPGPALLRAAYPMYSRITIQGGFQRPSQRLSQWTIPGRRGLSEKWLDANIWGSRQSVEDFDRRETDRLDIPSIENLGDMRELRAANPNSRRLS
ncbi:hypothetical protein E4U31_004214 [Claviceps sp. LM219 group G6]|nr:hypothetical protein E4U31_004214 [Claviceps sp. LM219 group G6]